MVDRTTATYCPPKEEKTGAGCSPGLILLDGELTALFFFVFKNCVAFKIKTPFLFVAKRLPLEFAQGPGQQDFPLAVG